MSRATIRQIDCSLPEASITSGCAARLQLRKSQEARCRKVQLSNHEASTGIPNRRWRITLLLGLGVLISYIDRVNVSVAKQALHDDFGVTTITFGYLLSAYSWSYAALQMPMGVFLDRFGVRRIGRVSSFLWSVASLGAAAATGVASFFGARLLLGVGEASTFPANAKAVGYWFPDQERSLATAIFDSAAKLSSAIGVPLAGLLLLHFGWRTSFAVTGIMSFTYFLIFWKVYKNPSEDKDLSQVEWDYIRRGGAQPEDSVRTKHGASVLYLLQQRKVYGLAIGCASYNYVFYLLLTWLPSYLSAALHIDLLHSVMYTTVPWLIATFTDLVVGGWLVDALIMRGKNPLRVRQAVLIGGTALGMGIFGAGYAHTPASALFWVSVSIGGLSAAAPVGWSIPSLIAPRESVGRVGGIVNLANQISAISAPILTGYTVAATNSYTWTFVIAAVFLMIGIASYAFLLGDMAQIPEPELA
jgi:ACS family D-galactonate transporter-like MFS transporter